MSVPCVARNSEEWIKSLGLENIDISRFYSDGAVPWNSDSAFAAEVWDFFTARAVIGASSARASDEDDDPDGAVSYLLYNWSRRLCEKLNSEVPTVEAGYAEGGRVMAQLSMDFAVWLSRLSDTEMSEYGGRLLGEMLRTGVTYPIDILRGLYVYSSTKGCFTVPVLTDGVYDERFLLAWGDSDLRVLIFYRAGVFDRSLIERCIAEGVEPDFASLVVA